MATQSQTTTSAIPIRAAVNEDVQAVLSYYPRTASPPEPVDFTKPEAEKKWDAQQSTCEAKSLSIHNIREREDQYTLFENGFQYLKDDVPALKECKTEDEIRDLLLPATEELVKRVTGAHKTVIFTHRIRSLAEDASRRADNKAPAHSVHTDFTPEGARNHLKTVVRDPTEMATLSNSRILAINVWRPLKTIRKDPLAILSWKSLDAKRDILPNRTIYSETFWAEMGNVRYDEGHEWVYVEEQTPSEPVMFVQHDSKRDGEGGMTLPHSAFVDERWVDAEVRKSIEIKMFAFVEQ